MPTKPKPTPLKRIARTLRYTLAFLLIALLTLRMTNLAEQLAYWPSRNSFTYQDITFQTPDGLTLHAWFMPAKNIPEGTKAPSILHAHGNAGNLADHESFSNFLTDAGFNVLLFDYRCYGRSDDQGPINRANLAIDTQAALDALMTHPDLQQAVDPTRIGILGISLGGPFALSTAANNPQVRAVATVSTFSSWQAIAKDASPLGPFLIKPGFDPVDSVANLTQPYLIIHAKDDQVVNFTHAVTLYQAAESAKLTAALHSYAGDHNSLLQTTPNARQALIEFFQIHLSTTSATAEIDLMFKSKSHTPESFWKWFSKRSNKFLTLEGEKLLGELSPELTRYHDGLVALLSPASVVPREFIISADGISANVDAVESLVDAAPQISNWKIIRFRPRFSDAGNGIQYGDVKIDTDAVQFVAFKDGSKIGVEIYAHWRKPEDGTDTDGPAFIMLDHTIGEYDVICGIGFIELHPLENAPDNARPWSEFAETFDRVFHGKED